MNIACPQCSTSYAISPEIIPAPGLPVRCTRCDFAFSVFRDGRVEGAAKVAAKGTTTTADGSMLSDEALASALVPPRTLTPVLEEDSASDSAPPRTSTQMMGQVAETPAAFAEPKTSTQMMGQVAETPAAFAGPKTSTQMMGQVSDAPAAFAGPKTSTQMMGQVSDAPAAFAEPKTSTQMMGRVSDAPAAFAEPKTSTQMMGQVAETPAAFAESKTSTQMMGQVSGAPAAFPESKTSTQMMGRVSDAPAAFAEPKTSTQMMGQVSAGAAASAPRSSTLSMGQLDPSEGTSGTPLMGTPHVERRATLDFGLEAGADQGSERRSTLDFGLDAQPPSGPRRTDELGAVHPSPTGAMDGLQVRLPPEEGVPPALLSRPFREAPEEAFTPATRSPQSSGRWRWVLLALVVIAAGAFGFQQFTAPLELPAEALAAHEDIQRLLRRDDAASLTQAREQLAELVARHPDFVAAQADQALILALQIDDQRALADAHVAAQSRLRMQIEAFERSQTPGDWRNRVNALRDGLKKHDQALVTIGKEETRLRGLLAGALEQLPDPSTIDAPEVQRALARAQLFSLAITGSPEAMGLMERFRRVGGSAEWQTVAESTYLLHAPGIQPSDAERMRERLAAIKDQDASWLRVYLLDARLARTMGAGESMRSNLEAVAVLNPEHVLARELRSLLQQR